ncbi:MAG: LysE family transporter [Syntrophomonadaceae bacterium]
MEFQLFPTGIVVGFCIAAPVGPIALLCIQRGLRYGFKAGLITGFGAAMADALYAGLAGWGLVWLSSFINYRHTGLQMITGVFFVIMGVRSLSTRPNTETQDPGTARRWGLFVSSFFLTLSNPMTFLAFAAVFAGLGLSAAHHGPSALMLMAGVAAGSAGWWLLLCTLVQFFHTRLNENHIRYINCLTGAIIMVIGVYLFLYSSGLINSILPVQAGL